MKKVFDGLTSGDDKGVVAEEPARNKAYSIVVQQRYCNSGVLPELINSNEVAEREAAR